jgi:hypothetical protein
MLIESATAVFAGISALSDAVHLYRIMRSAGETPTATQIENTMREAEVAANAKPSAAQELSNVIDEDVLETVKKNIEKEKERLKRSLSDPANDNAAKDKAIDIANSTICAELQRIKRLNGGKLPGPDYDRWWVSHSCG